MTTVEIPDEIHDKISELGTKEENFGQTLTRVFKIFENKSIENIPEIFDDYYQLENYFKRHGGFVAYRKVGQKSESVNVRVIRADNLSSFDLYYRLQYGKLRKCRGEDSLENMKSMEENT